jgi:hypothetical protein
VRSLPTEAARAAAAILRATAAQGGLTNLPAASGLTA